MTIVKSLLPKVIVFHDLIPETNAMALAMYSRDPRSVEIHREHIARVGAEKFMQTYYVGYGDKSIGDCGSTTICAENVSMLIAKAIQNNRLYNGQEASTRYLDMSAQPILNPLGTVEGELIQQKWMFLYSLVLQTLVSYLTDKYPMISGDDPKVYEKAIKAKSFDIARSFLPAGATTYVGWHTNLRQAWDHLKELVSHPLQEVRETACKMLAEVREKYPNSFGFKSYPEQDRFYSDCSQFTYEFLDLSQPFSFSHNFNLERLRNSGSRLELLKNRPFKGELPDWFDRYGQIQWQFLLDFGSYRDIQRQRSCLQIMPLLTTKYGFNPWYLNSMPAGLRSLAIKTIWEQQAEIESINDPYVRQYYIAMGYNVACEVTAGLPSAAYVIELRSGQTVHPTLRLVAQQMGFSLKEIIPEMALHFDTSPDQWTLKRGTQDIVKREN